MRKVIKIYITTVVLRPRWRGDLVCMFSSVQFVLWFFSMWFKMTFVLSVVICGHFSKIIIKNQMLINFGISDLLLVLLLFPYNDILTHNSEKITKKIYFESCIFVHRYKGEKNYHLANALISLFSSFLVTSTGGIRHFQLLLSSRSRTGFGEISWKSNFRK